MKTSLFESVRCTRCGGSGRMPFSVRGGICFKCDGPGFVLTKRGRAAQAYLDALRTIPAEDFKPGDLILSSGFSAGSMTVASKWLKVTEVRTVDARKTYPNEPEGSLMTEIVTEGGGSFGAMQGTAKWRKGFSAEEKAAQRAAALAYQDTLTKAGTPRKGKA